MANRLWIDILHFLFLLLVAIKHSFNFWPCVLHSTPWSMWHVQVARLENRSSWILMCGGGELITGKNTPNQLKSSTFPDWIISTPLLIQVNSVTWEMWRLSGCICSVKASSRSKILEFVFTKPFECTVWTASAAAAFLIPHNVRYFRLQSSGKWIAANRVRHFLQRIWLMCASNHYFIYNSQHEPYHTDKQFVWPRSNSQSANTHEMTVVWVRFFLQFTCRFLISLHLLFEWLAIANE